MKILIDTLYKTNEVANKYGLGRYLLMIKKAISYHKDMEITHRPENADVIHIHEPLNYYVIKKYKKYNKPIIAHFHSFVYNKDVVESMENSDLIVFVSNALAKRYTVKDYKVVHNAIIPPKKVKTPYRTIDFIVTSRQDLIKGLQNIICPENANAFIAVTTGDAHIDCFKPLGYLESKKFDFVLASSKIHILPSIFEAFGLATLYAMALGVVPAISPESGVIEVIPEYLYIKLRGDKVNLYSLYSTYEYKSMYELRDDISEFARSLDFRWYSEKIYELYREVVK